METKRIAIIRVRGCDKLKKRIDGTMNLMKLYNKNTCIVTTNNGSILGMINKVKDYVTWGEIDKDTFKALLEKRGKIMGNKPLSEAYLKDKCNLSYGKFVDEFFEFKKNLKDVPGLKSYFRLSPPKGGFERNGIKTPFSMGGALGYRKDKINEIIKRMT